jgi:hypothetical protein
MTSTTRSCTELRNNGRVAAMLNYKLLCRDADGNPINCQDVEAVTDAKAIETALELAQTPIYELWLDDRRVAVIEANDASTIDLAPTPPRRPARLHLWAQKFCGGRNSDGMGAHA